MELKSGKTEQSSVQSVERAFALLSIVASGDAQGTRLNEVVEQSGLTKTTAHRLLKQLVASGMLLQGPHRIYQLGPGAFELGVAAARSFPLRDLASPLLEALAEETGDTVFLILRSGSDTLCVDRKMGSYPVKVLTVDVGHRQPMGVGAAGLAILSRMALVEEQSCLKDISRKLAERPIGTLSEPLVRRLVSEARTRGWAETSNFAVRGVTGVGVALMNAQGKPFGAISVGAISVRMTPERVPQVAGLIKAKAAQLEQMLARRVGE